MSYDYPYPASLDAFGVKTDNVSTVYASAVNLCQNAVAALELKVGRDDSPDAYSIDYLISNFFDDGSDDHQRKMFFYMDTPPTGWSTTGLATNVAVGCKGGTSYWNRDGGTVYGTGYDWRIYDMNTDAHNHKWYVYDSTTYPYHYSYDSDGTTLLTFVDDGVLQTFCAANLGKVSNYQNTDGDRNWITASTMWTNNDSHAHTSDGTWRPLSAVGILAKYTGA